jgi:hypothetical protein
MTIPNLKTALPNIVDGFGHKDRVLCSTVSEAIMWYRKSATERAVTQSTLIVDGTRHSQLALDLFEREFYGKENHSQRIVLLTTKDLREETEALLPKRPSKNI